MHPSQAMGRCVHLVMEPDLIGSFGATAGYQLILVAANSDSLAQACGEHLFSLSSVACNQTVVEHPIERPRT